MKRYVVILVVALMVPVAHAGVVQTVTERIEGKISFAAEHVLVDGKKVPWGDILYLLADAGGAGPVRSQQVMLKNGEAWRCDVVRLADKKLTVRGELFGEKLVDIERVAVIDFTRPPGANAPGSPRKAQTLYRTGGDPIPGTLLSLDADKLSMDSILGKLNVPRDGLGSYVFSEQATAFEREIDEVALIDGTVLRGRLQPGSEGFKVAHPILGEVALPVRIVRSVVRHTPSVLDLTELAPQSVQTVPLTGAGPDQPARFRTARGDGAASRFIKGLLVEPKTVVRYSLPPAKGQAVTLRAVLMVPDGAAGDVRLRVRSGKEVRWEKELDAGGKAVQIDVELPAAGELELEVDFGTRLRFPCGVILGDPHLVLQQGK
jgi:hypothetical protein